MNIPLISIIIPTYNRALLIGDTLESILNQSFTDWECIVVDDGSVDDTKSILKKYIDLDNRFQYYERPKDRIKGPNSCRNFGFKKSKGKFINWFDSDDILFKYSLELWIKNFNSSIDAVIGKCEIFDSGNGKKLSENKILSFGNIKKDYFVGNITYYVSGPVWRRTFLEKQQELFDEEIRYLDDWDFNLRMIYQKPTIKFLDIPIFRYRFHPYSLSKQIEYSNFEEFKSECIARNKHLKLLSKKDIKNKQIESFLLKRYEIFLKEAIQKKDRSSKFFFFKLLSVQFKFKKYITIFKTIFLFFYKLKNIRIE
ncbi:glycosyltransferase family 2 protein [Polaribacter atrinae]|uniref:glycosyltransferase family 2 protein n=1 Tax=Polaribacter atrinae TaxID=1333662 RepID=UPI0024918427|nr:glycosyltransferase [Polaribacter atrinae]